MSGSESEIDKKPKAEKRIHEDVLLKFAPAVQKSFPSGAVNVAL